MDGYICRLFISNQKITKMKKTIFALLVLTLVFASSCNKNTPNPGGSWTFKGTTYNTTTSAVSGGDFGVTNVSTSNQSSYGGLTFSFFNSTPTTGGTFTVVNGVPASATQVAIAATTGGAAGNVYGSTGGNGSNQTVAVTVSNGKLSVSGSGIEMYNVNNASDSSAINFNITQLQ
jgi:hypothetical protein